MDTDWIVGLASYMVLSAKHLVVAWLST